MTPSDQRNTPYPITSRLTIKPKRNKKVAGTFATKAFVFQSNHFMYQGAASQEVGRYCLLILRRVIYFFFFFCVWPMLLLVSFFFLCQLRARNMSFFSHYIFSLFFWGGRVREQQHKRLSTHHNWLHSTGTILFSQQSTLVSKKFTRLVFVNSQSSVTLQISIHSWSTYTVCLDQQICGFYYL